MTTKILIAFFALAGILAVAAWPFVSKAIKSDFTFTPTTGTLTICLVDGTGSTDNPVIRASYGAALKAIIAGQSGGDTLVLRGISNDSSSSAMEGKTIVFPPAYSVLHDNSDDYTAHVDNDRAEALSAAKHLLDGHGAENGTDLFGALQDAGTVFASARHRDGRLRLIMLSDMLEQTDSADFTTDNLDAPHRATIIAGLVKQGVLPDLSGVSVSVAGATSGCRPKIASQRASQIHDFWLAYFKAAHAQLRPGQFGPTFLAPTPPS